MIRRIILLLSLACYGLVAQGQNSDSVGFSIKGSLNEGSGMAYLNYTYDGTQHRDSTPFKDGHFMFEGQVPGALFANVKIAESEKYINFFLENKELNISLNEEDDLILTGSSEHKVWLEWSAEWWRIHTKAGEIYKRLNDAYKKEGLDPNDKNAELSKEVRQPIDDAFAALDATVDSTVYNIADKYPNSIVIPYIVLNRYISWNKPEKAQEVYGMLTEDVQNSIYGMQVKAALDKDQITTIGKTAPEFTMDDQNGKPLSLSSLRGKYVIIDFWASWCGPCRKENPHVVKVYEKYNDQGLEILGVSLDSKKDKWLKAIEADELTWLHVSDLNGWKNSVAIQYGIKAVPSTFLLDRNGKIIARNLRGEELEDKLAELFD